MPGLHWGGTRRERRDIGMPAMLRESEGQEYLFKHMKL